MAIVLYGVLPERVAAIRAVYHPIAIMAVNAAAVIFWLTAMAALAVRRSTFRFATTITTCVNDGSGGVCVKRRALDLGKRESYVATYPYLNMMSAAAGICAIEASVDSLLVV